MHLEPRLWIHEARSIGDQPTTFGLDGTRDGDDRLTGRVLGPPGCGGFRAWHVRPTTQPQNRNGLMLKADLSEDDCRAYATWLASGRELRFDGYSVSSLLFDTDGQRRVLGRTADQWTSADASKYRGIAGWCQRSLAGSATLADADLMRRVPLFVVRPFDQEKQNWNLMDWDRAELIPLLRAEALGRASAQLARLDALPPSEESLAEIDREAALARGNQGELHYLEDGDRSEYQAKVLALRQALARLLGPRADARVTPLWPTDGVKQESVAGPGSLGGVIALAFVGLMIERIRSNDAGASYTVVSADPVPDLYPNYFMVEDDSLENVALALDNQEKAEAEAARKTAEDQQDAFWAEQALQQHEEEENAEIDAEARAQGR